MLFDDTIAAVATGMGEAGVAIVRISGPDAVIVADRAFRSRRKRSLQSAKSHTLTYGWVVNQDGQHIDEALAAVMRAPRSYTGEDVVEFQSHGGWVAIQRVLQVVLAAGARLAEPGEFTRRAFVNGRLDLSQAEAVIDIIRAKTDRAASIAVNQLRGDLSATVRKLRGALLEMIAHLEADIDFPELNLEVQTLDAVMAGCNDAAAVIADLLSSARQGRAVREGVRVVLAGRPNVGKSSLLNRLVRENRAIVTEIPGTTRDVIEEWLNIGGLPVVLADTAGIRETDDLTEKLGVDRSKAALARADVVLLVIDASCGVTDRDLEIYQLSPQDAPTIVVANKVDQVSGFSGDAFEKVFSGLQIIPVSALEGTGITELETAIVGLSTGGTVSSQDSLVSNVRHVQALHRAFDHLTGARHSLEQGLGSDIASIDVRAAWVVLGEIIGETVQEDLLDQIFQQFCIGK